MIGALRTLHTLHMLHTLHTLHTLQIPPAERSDMIGAYYRRLTSADEGVRLAAAKQWTTWEMCTSFAKPNPEQIAKGDDPHYAAAFARIESHFFSNGRCANSSRVAPPDANLPRSSSDAVTYVTYATYRARPTPSHLATNG